MHTMKCCLPLECALDFLKSLLLLRRHGASVESSCLGCKDHGADGRSANISREGTVEVKHILEEGHAGKEKATETPPG